MIKYRKLCEGNNLVKIFLSCHVNTFGINRRYLRKMHVKKNNE